MRRILLTAAAPAVALAGVVGAAAPAMAGNGPVIAVTHSFAHNDTTSVSGTATEPSPGGPVWARDNLMERFAVTDNGGGSYTVAVTVNGSFDGFADPRTQAEEDALGLNSVPGSALASQGSVKGTYTVQVSSPVGPDPSALLPQQPAGTGISAAIHQLFPGDDSTEILTGGPYTFTYTKVNGQVYQQAG
jgi:hypothetical protein